MREPDRNAPRWRYKYADSTSGLINKFKEKYPQYAHYPEKTLLKVLEVHNKKIIDTIINQRDGVELQSFLGQMFIGTTPPLKRKAIAFQESAKLGVKVYYNNYKTDNRILKIFYSNYSCQNKFKHCKLWEFTATRPFAHRVSVEGSQKWYEYHRKDPNKQIWDILSTRNYVDKARRVQKEDLKVYNEFDLE